MDFTSKNLTVPRGKIMFAPFRPGTQVPGEMRFFGNCPEFTFSREGETLDHYSSMSGVKNLDASIPMGGEMTSTVVCDDISPENMQAWFMGENTVVTRTAQTSVTYQIQEVKKGGFYQIGRTEQNLTGVQGLTSVTVSGPDALEEFADYEVDLTSGLLHILPEGTVTEGATVTVTYSSAAGTHRRITSGDRGLQGEVRFISDNPYGPNRIVIIPRVQVSPQGDLSFMTDPESPSWMQMSFAFRAMKKGNLPLIEIVDGLPMNADAAGTVEL